MRLKQRNPVRVGLGAECKIKIDRRRYKGESVSDWVVRIVKAAQDTRSCQQQKIEAIGKRKGKRNKNGR